jgi:multimeric flavodoxin WrbA
MASAVYFGDVSSQLKSFIDRTFCYLVPEYITAPPRSEAAFHRGKSWFSSRRNATQTRIGMPTFFPGTSISSTLTMGSRTII